jgi:hypothetical protein
MFFTFISIPRRKPSKKSDKEKYLNIQIFPIYPFLRKSPASSRTKTTTPPVSKKRKIEQSESQSSNSNSSDDFVYDNVLFPSYLIFLFLELLLTLL